MKLSITKNWKKNKEKFLDFYTYFKWVAKIIKRCLNIFILMFQLYQDLAKSSYGWLPFWLHKNLTKRPLVGVIEFWTMLSFENSMKKKVNANWISDLG
jgi:hypothetical protein